MMNVVKLLETAHFVLLDSFDGMHATDWSKPNVCGQWSSRQILVHLTSIERVLEELLRLVCPVSMASPLLDAYCFDREKFNSAEINLHANQSLNSIFTSYEQSYQRVSQLISGRDLFIPVGYHGLHQYGNTVADTVITLGYGHKLRHAAHVTAFRDQVLYRNSAE